MYDAFSKRQAQQIAKLWPSFNSSNSPRPPLAALYTTCIYKQHKGLTAVCKGRLPVFMFGWNLNAIIPHFKCPWWIKRVIDSVLNISIRLSSQIISPSVRKRIQQTCWQALSQWLWSTQKSCYKGSSQPFSLRHPTDSPVAHKHKSTCTRKRPWNETCMSAKIS